MGPTRLLLFELRFELRFEMSLEMLHSVFRVWCDAKIMLHHVSHARLIRAVHHTGSSDDESLGLMSEVPCCSRY